MERYKKRLSRTKIKENNLETPRKIVNKQITNGQNTFRKLLFAEVMSQQIKENYKKLQSSKKKRELTNLLSGKIIKKYRLCNTLKKITSKKMFNKYNKETLNVVKKSHLFFEKLSNDVTRFLESDKASRLCSGKKETITRNKQKMQKRFLNDSLSNLYEIFKKEFPDYNISYQTFCRRRPFWILYPKALDRETCLCKTHENMRLIIHKLKSLNIVNEKSSTEVLQSLCCDSKKQQCLDRYCEECFKKVIKINEFMDEDTCFYQWIREKVQVNVKGIMKMCPKTAKVAIQTTTKQLVESFLAKLTPFMKHVSNIVHQYEETKKIKENLAKNEVFIHIDFSENYTCKYNREVQSAHFGGSKPQVTIHTSVVYFNNEIRQTPMSFGTVSECNRHDAAAVNAHFLCLKEDIKSYVPDLAKVHILSDGPSTQYKNKTMFQLIGNFLAPKLEVDEINWHYSESSHGKGAPDGVGAVLKRTADSLVSHMVDIPNCETLVEALKVNCKNINVKKVDESSILEVDIFVPPEVEMFKGTMKIHEVVFQKCIKSLEVRSRTCTLCQKHKCKHYSLGTIQLLYPSTSRKLTVEEVYSDSGEENEQEVFGIQPNDYVIVKLCSKKTVKYFVSVIVSIDQSDISIKFMKKISVNKFVFEDDKVWCINKDDIMIKLDQPLLNNREQYVFHDITNLKFVLD